MPRLTKNGKPIILKNGTFIVSTTPTMYDKVQPLWGFAKGRHGEAQELKLRSLSSGNSREMIIYFDTSKPFDNSKIESGIEWLLTTSFKIIPKYAIPGFIAMQKKIEADKRFGQPNYGH